jgi:hypothetical protein
MPKSTDNARAATPPPQGKVKNLTPRPAPAKPKPIRLATRDPRRRRG